MGYKRCKNAGLALPLIALQYHEVKVDIEFRPFADLVITSIGTTTSASLTSASLYVDYIFLDTEERVQFAQIGHEYLLKKRRKVTVYKHADTVYRKIRLHSAKSPFLLQGKLISCSC